MKWSAATRVSLALLLAVLRLPAEAQAFDLCPQDKWYYVKEGTPEGVIIHTFNWTYNSVSVTDKFGYFRMENNSLVTNATMDVDNNEDLCKQNGRISIKFKCGNLETTSLVNINLTQNMAPSFQNDIYNVSIQERMPNGTAVFTLTNTAVKNDCVENAIFIYGIYGNTTQFRLEGNERIVTNADLDYDRGDKEFALEIWTKIYLDDYPRRGNATLRIFVKDMDDNDPVFNDTSYTITIQESNTSLISQPLWSTPPISAHDQDRDLDPPDPLIFDLPGNPDFLAINETSGSLIHRKVLDRETQAVYSVTVRVRQTRARYRSATTTLTVRVSDVNDNRPEFKVTDVTVDIPEHLSSAAYVTQVTAIDVDEGANAEFHYVLLNGTEFFSIDSNNGILRVGNSSALDREALSQIAVEVGTRETQPTFNNETCTGINCTVMVTVSLTDVNDNSPSFNDSLITFHVDSGIKGRDVGTVTATDRDQGENALLTYRIEPATTQTYLAVNASTGLVSLARDLPSMGDYTALLTACDSPRPPAQARCSSVSLRVVYRSNLTVDTSSINATVSENMPAGIVVTTLKGPLTYRTHNGNFSVQDYQLVTATTLDREVTPTFDLLVDVMVNSQVNHSFTVYITVEDVNDNHPQFSAPEYTFYIPEGAQKGSVLGNVTATDLDDSSNGMVRYEIKGSLWKSHFSINATSGKITLLKVPELSPSEVYAEVMVAALDDGIPSLMSIATVKIFIGSSGTVRIPTPAESVTISKERQYLEGALGGILNVTVSIEDVHSVTSSGETKSAMFISGRYKFGNQSAVSTEELARRVADNWGTINRLFDRYRSAEAPEVAAVMSTPVIALICVAVITFVVAVTAFAVICRKYERLQKQHQLYSHLSKDISIYAAPQTVRSEDDMSDSKTSSFASKRLVEENDSRYENVNVLGFTNRGFKHEDEETGLRPAANGNLPNGHVTTVKVEVQDSPREAPPDSGNVTPHSGSFSSDPDSGEHDLARPADLLEGREPDAAPLVTSLDNTTGHAAQNGVVSPDSERVTSLEPVHLTPRTDGELSGTAFPVAEARTEEPPKSGDIPDSPVVAERMRTASVEDLPPPPPPLHDDSDDDDDDNVTNSKFAFRPPTPPVLPPPPAFAPSDSNTGSDVPEEPDPDYKHVRFSDAVVELKNDVTTADDATSGSRKRSGSPPLVSIVEANDGEGDDDDDDDDDEESSAVEVTQAVVEINSPSDEFVASDDDIARFSFSLQDEITQF